MSLQSVWGVAGQADLRRSTDTEIEGEEDDAVMAGLPDMKYINREIPIVDVATSLGIRVGGKSAHCWRVGAHRSGDRSPSLSFHRNRAKCFVCDADSMSVIDLVLKHQACSLRHAIAWICERWTVPTIAKHHKLSRPERWKTSPVGVSSFPLEQLIRSGFWATLDDADRAVLAVLFCFAEKGEAAISYRGLCRYSGKASNTTIAKVLKHFKRIGLLKALPKISGNFREVRHYELTLNSLKFQTLLLAVHEHMKAERDLERRLRAEQKQAASTPNPTSYLEPYLGTTLSTTVDCDGNARYTTVKCAIERSKDSSISKTSIQEGHCDENKATCSTSQFSRVDRENEELGSQMSESSCYTHKGRAVWWARADGSLCCGLCHPDPRRLRWNEKAGLDRRKRLVAGDV